MAKYRHTVKVESLKTPLSVCYACGNKCCKTLVDGKEVPCGHLGKDGKCKMFPEMMKVCVDWECDYDYVTDEKLRKYYGSSN